MKLGQVIITVYKKNNLYILDAFSFTPKHAYIVMTNNVSLLINASNKTLYIESLLLYYILTIFTNIVTI